MTREILRGVASGVIVCALSVAVVSLIAPPPPSPIPPVAEDVAPAPAPGAAAETEIAALPGADAAPPSAVAPAGPEGAAPEPAAPGIEAAARPDVGAEVAAVVAPSEGARPALGAPPDPVLTPPGAVEVGAAGADAAPAPPEAPPAPLPAAAPEAAIAAPAPGPAPEVAVAPELPAAMGAAAVPDQPVRIAAAEPDVAAPPALPPAPPAPAAEVAVEAPVPAVEPVAPEVPEVPAQVAAPEPPVAGEAPEVDVEPVAPVEAEAPAGIAAPPAEDPAMAAGDPPAAPVTVVPPPEEPAPPRILAQVEPEEPAEPAQGADDPGSSMPGKRVGRLPTIGEAAATPDPAPAEAVAPRPRTGRPLDDNARPFENPEGRPILSVVLIDEGIPADLPAIEALGLPLTFAVDAGRPDAAEAMQAYRAAGQEVVTIAPLPAGAAPADAAVSFAAYIDALPYSVAFLEAEPGGLQSARQVTAQVVTELLRSGHGLIAYDSGLNPARQIAEREGLPFGEVYRIIDGEGQDKAAIKRFLDQAAFRAGQTGSVILVGHLRSETLAALAEWRQGSRAASVALAPVSAALSGQGSRG